MVIPCGGPESATTQSRTSSRRAAGIRALTFCLRDEGAETEWTARSEILCPAGAESVLREAVRRVGGAGDGSGSGLGSGTATGIPPRASASRLVPRGSVSLPIGHLLDVGIDGRACDSHFELFCDAAIVRRSDATAHVCRNVGVVS